MRNLIKLLIIIFFISSCGSMGQFGTGVNVTFDPRTIGMQIDDTIMQKNLVARLALTEKNIFLFKLKFWMDEFSWQEKLTIRKIK